MSRLKFACAGGNRNPTAADWARDGTLAFGAGNNVAIWRPSIPVDSPLNGSLQTEPDTDSHVGVSTILVGHTDVVNAVKFLYTDEDPDQSLLLTGSADKTIRVWSTLRSEGSDVLDAHSNAVNCIATADGFNGFVSGSADGAIKIWRIARGEAEYRFEVVQTIQLKPKYIPLAIELHSVEAEWILAIAGTRTSIQVYVTRDGTFTLASTLTGHEGWVRSLSFIPETAKSGSDLLLASASQDKYVRLWRLRKGAELPPLNEADSTLGVLAGSLSLSNKAHLINVGHSDNAYSLTFEALLLGHEDWVYTAAWRRWNGVLQLLTASADNSLAVWEADKESGVWLSVARLGEVSAQKGATTATGSTGGFWVGLWSPDGRAVASLGRTGSWRVWSREGDEGLWVQQVAVTGHVKEVKSLAWSKNGDYLLSTGSDQTTRLFAEWRRGEGGISWHEFSRPQIHGYDLNCIDTVGETQLISGAEEKLLRVFNEPQTVADLLESLCHIERQSSDTMPDAANIPVLGLSNKAIESTQGELSGNDLENGEEAALSKSDRRKQALNQTHPPTEDQLARHMLWPEHEKLYGHGYEISAVAASHDGSVIATACKASSIDHAVIRLYETKEWREVKPPLKAHSLTVHSLRFSADDQYLLSVGRDRQWTVFRRSLQQATAYEQFATDPKGHSRMILDCAWAPHVDTAPYVFATAGRDKLIKIWALEKDEVQLKTTITADAPVTAVDFLDRVVNKGLLLAYGTESGKVGYATVSQDDLTVASQSEAPKEMLPSSVVTCTAWRPGPSSRDCKELAVASDDHSVRVIEVS